MLWRQRQDPQNPENRNAGNGGDLVKRTVYLATLDYLLARASWSATLRLRECHTGRGMYALARSDTARRPLIQCLDDPLKVVTGVLLHDLQRTVQIALGTWPRSISTFDWYAGSVVTNAWRLGVASEGQRQLELYQYSADTRRILRDVFKALNFRWPRLRVLDRCDQLWTHLQRHGCGGRLKNPDIEVQVDQRTSLGNPSRKD